LEGYKCEWCEGKKKVPPPIVGVQIGENHYSDSYLLRLQGWEISTLAGEGMAALRNRALGAGGRLMNMRM
jgi:hypothetical protein